MAAVVLIVVFLVVLIAGMPISMGMGFSTLAALFAGDYSLSTLILQIEKGAGSYSLVAIPYFVLAASIMNKGGITNRIFDFAESLCNWSCAGQCHLKRDLRRYFGNRKCRCRRSRACRDRSNGPKGL